MDFRLKRLIVLVASAALILAGCSSDPDEEESEPGTGDSTELVPIHPLTGEELPDGRPDHPVFVVKVDNTSPAAPQTGLNHADLIVEQLVEGGETRFAAMYYSTFPEEIGHVRSMRGTDVGIALPVDGRVVASGGAGPTIRVLREAGVPMHLMDSGGTGFRRSSTNYAPYNVMLNLQTIADRVDAGPVEGSYMRFGDGIADLANEETGDPLAEQVSEASVRFSPRSTRTFALNGGDWIRTNGLRTVGGDFTAPNLIVIKAPVTDAGYRDPGGAAVPETVFAGSGDAWIAQGDQVIRVVWNKDDRGSQLTFETSDGQSVGINPGRTWIMLIPEDQPDPVFD